MKEAIEKPADIDEEINNFVWLDSMSAQAQQRWCQNCVRGMCYTYCSITDHIIIYNAAAHMDAWHLPQLTNIEG